MAKKKDPINDFFIFLTKIVFIVKLIHNFKIPNV